MTTPVSKPTQAAYPWRATVRTVFQAVIALLAAAPVLFATAGLDGSVGAAATFLAVSAAVTRFMALPVVNEFIERYVPWLAAQPG